MDGEDGFTPTGKESSQQLSTKSKKRMEAHGIGEDQQRGDGNNWKESNGKRCRQHEPPHRHHENGGGEPGDEYGQDVDDSPTIDETLTDAQGNDDDGDDDDDDDDDDNDKNPSAN